MEDIKKIKLKDEQQVENNGSAVKNPKRLQPTGSGSGQVFNGGSSFHAQAELYRGDYKWLVSVSASISVRVKYKLEDGELVFDEATVTCAGASATFGGTTRYVGTLTPEGEKLNGIEYSSLSCYPSVSGQSSQTVNSICTVDVGVCSVELKGYSTAYYNGNPQQPGQLQTFLGGVALRISFNCDPQFGVYQVGAEIIL